MRRALEVAFDSETKAYAFFDAALESITDPEVRALFAELRREEAEHQNLVRRELDKLPRDAEPGDGDDDEETFAH